MFFRIVLWSVLLFFLARFVVKILRSFMDQFRQETPPQNVPEKQEIPKKEFKDVRDAKFVDVPKSEKDDLPKSEDDS